MKTILKITAVLVATVSAFVAVKVLLSKIGVSTVTYFPVDEE